MKLCAPAIYSVVQTARGRYELSGRIVHFNV
jgi:hypothetical protein